MHSCWYYPCYWQWLCGTSTGTGVRRYCVEVHAVVDFVVAAAAAAAAAATAAVGVGRPSSCTAGVCPRVAQRVTTSWRADHNHDDLEVVAADVPLTLTVLLLLMYDVSIGTSLARTSWSK
jgi:hypothetical protein